MQILRLQIRLGIECMDIEMDEDGRIEWDKEPMKCTAKGGRRWVSSTAVAQLDE